MDFLKKLFKINEIKINDSDFGELLLIESNDPNYNYWEGQGIFLPDNLKVEYFIATTDTNPPSTSQRKFLKSIYSKIGVLKKKWEGGLDKEMRKWRNYSGINPLDSYMKISSIEIPKQFNQSIEWEITFRSIKNIYSEHSYKIKMTGWEVTGVLIDG